LKLCPPRLHPHLSLPPQGGGKHWLFYLLSPAGAGVPAGAGLSAG
jgi:hypothetical protein